MVQVDKNVACILFLLGGQDTIICNVTEAFVCFHNFLFIIPVSK